MTTWGVYRPTFVGFDLPIRGRHSKRRRIRKKAERKANEGRGVWRRVGTSVSISFTSPEDA